MNKVIERARELVTAEVPFLHQGRDFNGIDCVGCLVYAFEHPLEDVPGYPRDPYRGELDRQLMRVFGEPLQEAEVAKGGECLHRIDVSQLREADIVSMQYRGPVRHVGIIAEHPAYPGHLSLIHTDATVGKVTEHLLDEMWADRIVRVYRRSAD